MRNQRATLTACLILGALAFCARPASAQIAKIVDDSGRRFFINSNPTPVKIASTTKSHTNIYLPGEVTFTGRSRPAVDMDRDGVEKLIRPGLLQQHGRSADAKRKQHEPAEPESEGKRRRAGEAVSRLGAQHMLGV